MGVWSMRTIVIGALLSVVLTAAASVSAVAQPQPGAVQQTEQAAHRAGGEANLVLPPLSGVTFRGIEGRALLMGGLGICGLGLLFGLVTFNQLKNLPVHPSMREVSELIYETCKTYL